jgi:hypothetical protein
MKKAIPERFTPAQRAELKSLASRLGEEIDTLDAPELLDWSGAKRGLFYRPIKQSRLGAASKSITDEHAHHEPLRSAASSRSERVERTG